MSSSVAAGRDEIVTRSVQGYLLLMYYTAWFVVVWFGIWYQYNNQIKLSLTNWIVCYVLLLQYLLFWFNSVWHVVMSKLTIEQRFQILQINFGNRSSVREMSIRVSCSSIDEYVPQYLHSSWQRASTETPHSTRPEMSDRRCYCCSWA